MEQVKQSRESVSKSEVEDLNSKPTKANMYSPRRRRKEEEPKQPDFNSPRYNLQTGMQVLYEQILKIENYTKKIEDYTSRIEGAAQQKIQVDEDDLKNAVAKLNEPIVSYREQEYRMRVKQYVDTAVYWRTALGAIVMTALLCIFIYLWGEERHKNKELLQQNQEFVEYFRTIENSQGRK